MRLMLLYPIFVMLLLLFLLFSVMYNQIEDSSNNNSVRRKKGRKKLWRTSCLHGITKNVAKTQCSYRISHFRSVRFHTPFSSTFCCFLFLFCFVFFFFRFFIKCSIVFPKCLFKVAQILVLKMDISACS